MMKKLTYSLIIALFSFTVTAQPCKEVVGYYAGWKYHKRNKLVNPATIIYSNYTIINYAFFKPLPGGEVVPGDLSTDNLILLGNRNKQLQHDKSTSLVYKAHQNGVKVVVSVGGWTWSSHFPAIAADPSKRKNFVNSCIGIVRKYGVDGIDIDWEYPGHAPHNGTPDDKANLTLLISELKAALVRTGISDGKNYLLTLATGPAQKHMAQIDWPSVEPQLDLIHLMSYNYYGAWDKTTNHNTPLYKPATGNFRYNVDHSVTLLTDTFNIPSSKITLGLAFYGRTATFQDEVSLHAPSTGIDAVTFPDEKGTPSYFNIMLKQNLFDKEFDEVAKVPYLTGKNGSKAFVSFDDEISIGQKTAFAVQKNMAGVVIWDISGDYIETKPGSGKIAGTPLCNAILANTCQGAIASGKIMDFGLKAYPNPVLDEMDIVWSESVYSPSIEVLSASGQKVFSGSSIQGNQLKINTSSWSSGIYLVSISAPNEKASVKVVKL